MDGRAGEIQLREVDVDAVVSGDEVDHVVQRGEHAEAEQVAR
ncbi:hypothetical protein [Amycolatopsis anabasis]|nr:hypothetical protein [Amycolatopsis anabasis]